MDVQRAGVILNLDVQGGWMSILCRMSEKGEGIFSTSSV